MRRIDILSGFPDNTGSLSCYGQVWNSRQVAELKNIVGPRVRELRNRLGWSQEMLAAKCQMAGWDISRSIVAAIEGRVRWVGDFELVTLASIFRVEPSELFPTGAALHELSPPAARGNPRADRRHGKRAAVAK